MEMKLFENENLATDNSNSKYTKKVETPIYKPRGEKPHILELMDCERTKRLVNEIGVKEMPSGYAVAAPVKHTDKGTAENMYYAEYGAGIMAEGGDSNTIEPWIYKTTYLDSAPVATKKGNRKIPYKWWTKTKGWLGITDRSRPAHYMAAARRYIRNNWNSHFRKAINTVIYRRAK